MNKWNHISLLKITRVIFLTQEINPNINDIDNSFRVPYNLRERLNVTANVLNIREAEIEERSRRTIQRRNNKISSEEDIIEASRKLGIVPEEINKLYINKARQNCFDSNEGLYESLPLLPTLEELITLNSTIDLREVIIQFKMEYATRKFSIDTMTMDFITCKVCSISDVQRGAFSRIDHKEKFRPNTNQKKHVYYDSNNNKHLFLKAIDAHIR